ncbi:hypothetical protein IWX92DRAFT_360703 [Phyllosticta citricarpa]
MSSMTGSTSFVVPPSHPSSTSADDDVDSLPSSSTGDLSSDYDDNDAEREWRESLQQLELLLTMVVVPYLGKYFGRKCAYWSEYILVLSSICAQKGGWNCCMPRGNPACSLQSTAATLIEDIG